MSGYTTQDWWKDCYNDFTSGDRVMRIEARSDMIKVRREAALERRIAALEREVANASEVIEGAYVTLGNGDFNNGVTDCSGLIDEGEVYAGRTFEEMRQWLLKHKTRLNYVSSEMSAP